jgi:proline iminopeptidase
MVEVPGGAVWTGRYGVGDGAAGDALPLVCLHGGPGFPSFYLEPMLALGDEREVVFYDQLGCGRSERPDDESLWTVDRAVEELQAVLDALGLTRFHLLGHSWGGFLALEYTARSTSVASLIMSSPLVCTDDWMSDAADLLAELPVDVRQVIAAGSFDSEAFEEATMTFYRRYLCRLDPWPEALRRTFDEANQQTYVTMWGPSEFTQTGNLAGADLTGHLAGLRVPSLWLAGTLDEARPARVRSYAARAPRATFVEIDGASHCTHLERPDVMVSAVRAFLNDEVER